jgi:signal recognition particle subunit SEC65
VGCLRDKIEFDEPSTLEDTIQKARYYYEHFKNKEKPHKDWKKKSKLGFKKKGFKSSILKNHGKRSKMSLPTKSAYQQNFPSQSGNKSFGSSLGKTDNTKREPCKCRGCGEEHFLRDYPDKKQYSRRVDNIHKATTVNDVARSMPQNYATMDNRHVDHQD